MNGGTWVRHSILCCHALSALILGIIAILGLRLGFALGYPESQLRCSSVPLRRSQHSYAFATHFSPLTFRRLQFPALLALYALCYRLTALFREPFPFREQ
jgi:hypothetical protein